MSESADTPKNNEVIPPSEGSDMPINASTPQSNAFESSPSMPPPPPVESLANQGVSPSASYTSLSPFQMGGNCMLQKGGRKSLKKSGRKSMKKRGRKSMKKRGHNSLKKAKKVKK